MLQSTASITENGGEQTVIVTAALDNGTHCEPDKSVDGNRSA